jgi:hypothetical protein
MATNNHCFDISNAKDFFDKMLVPYMDEYRKDTLSSSKALMSCILLWQFAEWVYHSHPVELSSHPANPQSCSDLRKVIVGLAPGYQYVGMVATGAKHFHVTNPHMQGVVQTELMHGFWNPFLFIGLTESHLFIKMADGSSCFLDCAILDTMIKWDEFCRTTLSWL